MIPSDTEVPLTGGRITAGVVRIGDTVRRPPTSASPYAAKLLAHLEAKGFSGSPRYLGSDDQGRDTFSYLPGSVPAKFQHFNDHQVSRAGALLRAFHDATRGSELAYGHAVICHHDAGPNNFVFQNHIPVALIDFDLASPGDPLEDIGYMAWLWCISSKPERQPVGIQAAQVRLLVDAYELSSVSRANVFDSIIERQTWNIGFWEGYINDPHPAIASAHQVNDRIEWTKREQAYATANKSAFETALR